MKTDTQQKFVACRVLLAFTLLMAVPAGAAAGAWPQRRPLRDSTQMIVVTTPGWNTVSGSLQRYQRSRPGKHWKRIGQPVPIVVGKNGMGWGAGLLTTESNMVRNADDPVKKEGDGKSPAGVFGISTGFGYADKPPAGWKLSYIRLTPGIECVDDPTSRYYNKVVDRGTVTPDWNSSEHMASTGEYYRWGAVVDHNVNPAVPGGGSCIFLHIWGGAGMGTTGCTAMAQGALEPILAWLDPAARPVLMQLPVAQYGQLKKAWKLPKPPKMSE
jgi:D-alanyl-D-alanine dipeptidase